MNTTDRRTLLAGIGIAAAFVAVLFLPFEFSPEERVPAKLFAAQVWTLEASGRGELVSRVQDRSSGVSDQYRVLSVDRGDVASFELVPGLVPGSVVTSGDTVAWLQSTRSNRELTELSAQVSVESAEVATFSEGAKQARVEAEEERLRQLEAQVALQERIVSRLRQLRESGVVSADEVDRAETAEIELRGRIAVVQAELAVLREGARPSEQRLARTRLQAAREQLAALTRQRRSFSTVSPVSGTITRSDRDSVLVTVKTLDDWVAVAPVPLKLAEGLAVGTEVAFARGDAIMAGQVRHVAETVGRLAGEWVAVVTFDIEAPAMARDRMPLELVLQGQSETLRGRVFDAVRSLFEPETWWSNAPRD